MQTAILERTQNLRVYESQTVFTDEATREAEFSFIRKLNGFVKYGLVAVVLLSGLVGALNAYATNLAITASKMDSKLQLIDEQIRELQDSLDSGYNEILVGTSSNIAATSNESYFVKDTWETGG